MIKLSVNINKLATLRNARGENNPDLSYWTKEIQSYGAHGITIHPRPDERHIKRTDVFSLKPLITKEFNIEGYPSEDFIQLIQEVKPEQCTLVPDGPNVITSDAGWNLDYQDKFLESAISKLKNHTRVSVFMEPETTTQKHAEKLVELGASRAEIYTKEFASFYNCKKTQKKYRECADTLLKAGLSLNAGHDLDLNNLDTLISIIPELKEVSIGHALFCESLHFGVKNTIEKYLNILNSH